MGVGVSALPGCWMASHLWTAARRYINHSCAPNCVAEVVTFERVHKIIISSSRRIQKGEEVSSAPTHPRCRCRGALLTPPVGPPLTKDACAELMALLAPLAPG